MHAAMLESAAIGIPDDKWGEMPLMIITIKPDYRNKVIAEESKQFMKKFADEDKLHKCGVLDRHVFVDAIPKISMGKLDNKVFRKTYNNSRKPTR
jgi:fatty-acyl-CoA synthase